MKKFLSILAMAGIVFTLASCGDDDGDGVIIPTATYTITESSTTADGPQKTVAGIINEDITFGSDTVWILSGRVFVSGEATLTIEAGTIIKGDGGTGASASALHIATDGNIEAVGTAANPIIFTSVDDNIAIGEKAGTSLDETDNETWGGVVILGNAPISPESGTTAQIEGVFASEIGGLGQYGGDDATHDQGTFRYVSIRHGGTSIDPTNGNDINGLTLGGVGSGTEISYVEVIANLDDGVEFFGGTVDASNILVYGVGDDAIDVDQAYAGTVDNFWIFTSTTADSDEGLEIDGPEGSDNAEGEFTIENGTITSLDGGGSAADFKSKAQGNVTNVLWNGFDDGSTIQFRASFDPDNSCADETDAYTNLLDDVLVFTTVEFDNISVYDGDSDDTCDVPEGHLGNAEDKLSSSTATGASNTSAWDGWTLADELDLLDN